VTRLAVVVVLVLASAGACKSRKSGTQWIDPNQLTACPIRHAALAPSQVERLEALQRTFADVDPTPPEKWIEDFQHDQNPEREILIYEAMARAYRSYCEGKTLSLTAKEDVYRVVLLRSGAPEAEVLPRLKLKELTMADAKEILRLYTAPPAPIRVQSR
jgi:hypothetical protein